MNDNVIRDILGRVAAGTTTPADAMALEGILLAPTYQLITQAAMFLVSCQDQARNVLSWATRQMVAEALTTDKGVV